MLGLRTLLVVVLACCASAHAQSGLPAPQPYVLEGTEVHSLHAEALHRDYELFISLPASYARSTRSYPVLFVTDANYGFPVMRSIAKRVGNAGKNIEEFILVGLSYAKGDTPEYSRRRDYTPTPNGEKNAVSDMPGRAPVFGQAEAYRQFIASQVFPYLSTHYRADMNRKIFVGHSYGSLLGLHILFTEPSMFGYFVLGSPSLWFDDQVMFRREREYAASHRDLKANVFMAAGAFEAVNPKSRNPRYNDKVDMVRDLQALERVLKSRHYPGLRISSQVIADEDHLTVAPIVLTRGLMWALGQTASRAEAAR